VNAQEARRFAHRLVAEVIGATDFNTTAIAVTSPDWPRVEIALSAIREQHHRFGPKSTDRAPRAARSPHLTPLLDVVGA
jgi:hypothetical protein